MSDVMVPSRDEMISRAVPLDGVHNFRDVAGYRTADGRVTREGRLFRSDALHALGDESRERLAELDVRTVVDLRTDQERRDFPDAIGDRIRLAERPIFPRTNFDPAPAGLLEVYEMMIERFGDELVGAIRELAQPEALPAVVHCTAGKDRTGVVVALVLSAVGVPDEVVATDFAATEYFLTQEFLAVLTKGGPKADSPMLRSDIEHMRSLLARISAEHGGALAYLKARGLTDDEFATLRDGLTEPAEGRL